MMGTTLAQLMNQAITEEYVASSEWRNSYVVPFYKSGDPEVASNFRELLRVVVWPKFSQRC